jgi:hypothetical protein
MGDITANYLASADMTRPGGEPNQKVVGLPQPPLARHDRKCR